jgi:hypothetical protein
MGDGADVLWKVTDNGFQRSAASLSSAAMKGSGGSLKFIITVGEALRTTLGAGNNCGEDEPVLGTPFIRQRLCVAVHLGIELTGVIHAPASMHVHSLWLPGVAEYKSVDMGIIVVTKDGRGGGHALVAQRPGNDVVFRGRRQLMQHFRTDEMNEEQTVAYVYIMHVQRIAFK